MNLKLLCIICQLLVLLDLRTAHAATADKEVSVTGFSSIQEAIDANPGRMIYIPAGDYTISRALQINKDDTGLFGPGRIIQTNPEETILAIEDAARVSVRDLILTRAAEKMDTAKDGVSASDCDDLCVEGVQLIDNRSRSGGIALRGCVNSQVLNCLILNYTRIAVDDRTANVEQLGYAFNCIDGTGLVIFDCMGTLLQGNRIIEKNLLPTPENKEKYDLGTIIKKNEKRGFLISQETWDRGYVNNWHQGSGLIVGMGCDYTRVIGNYIENAAQGIDIHSDHVTITNNIVNNAFMGMKAMHGSRNVAIIGNQFSKNDLWAIGLMPGVAARSAKAAEGDKPAVMANVDAGHIIANNIISDFGYGTSYWIWKGQALAPILLNDGQEPEDPPLTDVVVNGNIVYDTGRDQVLADGVPKVEPPRYKWAVYVSPGRTSDIGSIAGPKNVYFANNILHPGTEGVANVDLMP